MNNGKKWWFAAAGALVLAGVIGAGAVMAQEPTTTQEPTQEPPATQETPAAGETPATPATPGGGQDGEDRPRGGCSGKFASEELAALLGITVEQLREELAVDGATLATVAAAHGVSRDQLITFLVDEKEAHLAEKVAAGDLTQAEADERLAAFSDNVGELIDSEAPVGRGFRGGPRAAPEGSDGSGDSSGSSS